jgi:hypothetical protein
VSQREGKAPLTLFGIGLAELLFVALGTGASLAIVAAASAGVRLARR